MLMLDSVGHNSQLYPNKGPLFCTELIAAFCFTGNIIGHVNAGVFDLIRKMNASGSLYHPPVDVHGIFVNPPNIFPYLL